MALKSKLQTILLISGAISPDPSRKPNATTWKRKLTSSMNIVTTKTIRETYKGINELKKGYQPLAYVIKKHDGTIVADIK